MTVSNVLTISRMVLAPVVVALLFPAGLVYRFASLSVFFIAVMTDWYDGYLARKSGNISAWGAFWDPLADKILTLSTFFAFALYEYVAMWMVIAIAARDVLITLLRTYAQYKNKPVVTSVSAKWKTASQMAVIYLIMLYLIAHSYFLGAAMPQWLHWIDEFRIIPIMMHLVTLITIATGVQYLYENRGHLRSLGQFFFRIFAARNLAK